MVETADILVEWREHIHPRHGGAPGPAVVMDEDAARRAREWERTARPIVEEMLEHERTPADLAAATRAWLDGKPDPVGAAATATVVAKYRDEADGAESAAFLDAWVLDHGLAFAACAVTEASSIALGPAPEPVRPSADGVIRMVAYTYADGPPKGWRGEIRRTTAATARFTMGHWIAEDQVVKRLRTLLAAAPEAEYQEVVARIAAHRDDVPKRSTASYLIPTETAWTDETLDDWSGLSVLDHEHLLASLSTAAHASRIGWIPVSPAVIGTLLDGLGADALTLFSRAIGYDYMDAGTDETHPVILKAVLEIADEAVFPVLLDHMGEKRVLAALHEAVRRYPDHALRALAPLVGQGTTKGLQAAGLVLELRPADHSTPDCDDLPAVLRGKPTRSAKVDWVDPALLPQILTRTRDRALPADATRRLLTLLAKKSPGPAEAAAIAEVRAFCDRHSLAEFSWAVFQRWHAFGGPTRHNWALAQLGLIGDDTTVRRLSPLMKHWPGEGRAGRATAALEVLARIGSDVALTHLFELTRGGRYKGLKAKAAQKIDEIAAARGITPDALADRAVPDFGLDARGTLVLDYGPRQFTVTFNEQLAPLVVEPNGKVRKSAPKPGPKDDPALAAAAHALFTGLKKDLRTIADQEIKRLENAMTTRRTWTPDDFHALFVTHPLMGHIVRRLVWITDGGTAFRIAEDRTYADVNDDPFTPEGRIGIAHPIVLDDLDAWVELFADYEILQPFEQLGRPVYRLTDDERSARRLTRCEGLTLSYGKAKGHSQGRWESLHANGEFSGSWLSRRDPAGLHVVANLTPGLYYYMYGEGEDQEISILWAGPSPANVPQDSVPLGQVDPVTMSEVIHDLSRSAT
ncbi:DUF4132 domain-containing protein [Actinomadura barringtoniae]|uniref:DUF4132 domain-containing protein n=1 Tax=Actinomadura barringtoniae TaxID=1427535 RepID=A0A939T5H9_9ACTN|nr:DUF4132 domain-containing protein [Actinomadura barringtoniae]MBO2449529.1 DUF4132 domain-containing protein [Actinomadura barringtoniae]